MDENEEAFQRIFQKMMDDHNLCPEDIKTMAMFVRTVESGDYVPKLNKKAFTLFSKKMGIKPFEAEEPPIEFDAVIPLFRYANNIMEHYASGVLIEIWDNIYLLTASHVVENVQKIFMPIAENIVGVEGGCYFIPSAPEQLTNIDFAYIKVEQELSISIKNHMHVLKVDDIDWKHELKTNDFCVFTGYPYRKSKNQTNIISTEFYEYVGPYSTELNIYKKKFCDLANNIIMRYNFRHTTTRFGNDLKEVVSPGGISGGGIFTSNIKTKNSHDKNQSSKLIGIAHSYDRQMKVLIGTKIDYCLRYMATREESVKKILLSL